MDQQAKFFRAAGSQPSLLDKLFYPVIGTASAVLIVGMIALFGGKKPAPAVEPAAVSVAAPKAVPAPSSADAVVERGVKPPAPPPETVNVPAPETLPPQSNNTLVQSRSTFDAKPAATDADALTVYVTKTGSKYHCAGCEYLRQSSIPMPLSEARAKYTACSVCGGTPAATPIPVAPPSASTRSGSTGSGTATGSTTATGLPLYVGPRGGVYHYSKTGNKVYEKRR